MSSIMCVSAAGDMVTLSHVSVEDPDDGSPLLPEAAEAGIPIPVTHKRQVDTNKDSGEFSLRR